jgi:hypothetical protein
MKHAATAFESVSPTRQLLGVVLHDGTGAVLRHNNHVSRNQISETSSSSESGSFRFRAQWTSFGISIAWYLTSEMGCNKVATRTLRGIRCIGRRMNGYSSVEGFVTQDRALQSSHECESAIRLRLVVSGCTTRFNFLKGKEFGYHVLYRWEYFIIYGKVFRSLVHFAILGCAQPQFNPLPPNILQDIINFD